MMRRPIEAESSQRRSHVLGVVSRRSTAFITHAPWLLALAFGLALVVPATRPTAIRLLLENNVVELATFATFVAGGAWGLRVAWRASRASHGGAVAAFYGAFSLGMIVIGMEEIAWGQWLFGFDTPDALLTINAQREFTLHNIRGMQGHSEFLRLAFGLGGLIGIALSRYPRFVAVGAPAMLLPWFLVIVALAVPDLINDYVPFREPLQSSINILSELVELLIAISAALYLVLNHARLSGLARSAAAPP